MKEFIRFSLIILTVCSITFGLHLVVLHFNNQAIFENRIILAYAGNYVIAIIILLILLKAPKRLKNSLGFLFMLGSGFKFGFFFLCFYGYYLIDGDISRTEFFAFFIPYSASLISETKLLINKLSE